MGEPWYSSEAGLSSASTFLYRVYLLSDCLTILKFLPSFFNGFFSDFSAKSLGKFIWLKILCLGL